MRFTTAWSEVSKQNNILRIAILSVSIASILSLLVLIYFAFKDPLIIERGCLSKVSSATSNQSPTKEEVENFIRDVLAQRFNTDTNAISDNIAIDELSNRSAEQEELKRRGIRQTVLVNSVTKKDNTYQIDCDRIMAVGSLRSALPFPLLVTIDRATRSQANPYGLVLLKVSALNKDGEKNEKK
jgi:hypothetical protein